MRKLLICSLLLLALEASAKSMKEMWIAMPDSMIPYLTKNLRTEMADLVAMNVHADVKNKLQGASKIDTLQETYLKATLNKASVIQMRLLPTSGRDTVVCVVRNFFGPATESEVSFYNQNWEPLGTQAFRTADLTQKPDTMSEEKYKQLCAMVDPAMIHAELSADRDELVITLSVPLLSNEIKKQVNPVILQKSLKWNGKTFN